MRDLFNPKIIVFCVSWVVFIFASYSSQGQLRLFPKKKKGLQLPAASPPDKQYIADYHKELTARIYGSRKFTTYGLYDKGYAENILYRPNTPFNIGAGINYRILGINLGFNLPGINDNKVNGKTKFLDIQTHVYGRKLLIDAYLQNYKGFYLADQRILLNNNTGDVYLRPDLHTIHFGLSAQYVPNGKRFSFRGAFLQNEVQLKSAGSPLIGGSFSDVLIRADSSIVPSNTRYTDYFDNFSYNRSNLTSLGFSFGYGYTFVLPYHLFLTAAGTAGVGVNYTNMRSATSSVSGFGTDLNLILRVGMGYNSRRYYAGFQYLGTLISSNTPIIYARQQFGSGNFRISVARRFTLKRKLLGFY